MIAVKAFLQRSIKLFDEPDVFFRAIGRHGREFGKDLLHAGGANRRQDAILLQNLTADVEGQVFAIDDAADEAQVGG